MSKLQVTKEQLEDIARGLVYPQSYYILIAINLQDAQKRIIELEREVEDLKRKNNNNEHGYYSAITRG